MTPRTPFALVLAVAMSGCSLATADQALQTTNSCSNNGACGTNGVCATVGADRACVATTSDLGQVILEVRPAADVNGNVVSSVFTDKLTLSGPIPPSLPAVNLGVQANVTFSGQLFAPVPTGPAPATKCTGSDGSLQVKVELHAITQYPSLASTYTANAVQDASGHWVYSLSVPAGTYDVYLTPQPVDLKVCATVSLPPRLVRGVDVTKNVHFSSGADGMSRVYGTLIVPKGKSVQGWFIEVVDPTYGFVISDSTPLPDPMGATSVPILGGPNGTDPQGLRYYGTTNPIIRCRSAPANGAPTDPNGTLIVHWTLAGVDALGTGNVTLNLNDLLATQIPLQATVVDQNQNGVAASVLIQSAALPSDAKASYRWTAQTDALGQFKAALVQGAYNVVVTPTADSSVTSVQSTWTVDSSNLGFGKTFVLPQRPIAQGTVVTPSGGPVSSVPVVATAHAPDMLTYFSAYSTTTTSLVARDGNITTDAMGMFSFPIDPVAVDFSVRPDASSRFGWLVVPGLLVNSATVTPVDNLKPLTLSAPVLVNGTVSSPDGVVPSAVIRAYIPVPPTDKTAPPNLVQIGETVSDANGHYELPLPPSVSVQVTP